MSSSMPPGDVTSPAGGTSTDTSAPKSYISSSMSTNESPRFAENVALRAWPSASTHTSIGAEPPPGTSTVAR